MDRPRRRIPDFDGRLLPLRAQFSHGAVLDSWRHVGRKAACRQGGGDVENKFQETIMQNEQNFFKFRF